MCSEKREIVFRGAFLTILFPIDRFSELGPSSRTFFSEGGFCREQIIESIHAFYQVNSLQLYPSHIINFRCFVGTRHYCPLSHFPRLAECSSALGLGIKELNKH